jgi:synaptosomal-associated protein 29
MAGSSSFSFESNRPFFSTEEEDMDRAFLKTTPSSKIEERRMQLLAEKKQIEDRTIQSSMRSISLLRESEDIGIATAEELALQREALQRTERKLDDIKSNLRVSQRHITGIKSIFGSVKNYFSGGKDTVPKSIDEEPPVPRSHSDLSDLIAARNNSTNSNSNNYEDHPAARRHLDYDYERTSTDVDKILDNNLEEMGSALSRLKLLGINLGEAIEGDNQLIDRIQAKADSADIGIQRQTKDMERILKK